MTNPEDRDFYISQNSCKALAKLLKIDEAQIKENKHLFYRIDPYTAQCFEYLSQISSDDLKISAALSLNYLINYKESAFD